MYTFFSTLFPNAVDSFRGKNIRWHITFWVVTVLLVYSGFDWWYFESTRGTLIQTLAWPAVIVGFLLPIALPVCFWAIGILRSSRKIMIAGFALAQAGVLGLGISSLYKVFTGRTGPHGFMTSMATLADGSRGFRFGFYRGGAFQGWPSSHTTVAFAMSAALIALYPNSKPVRYIAWGYALYIGLGVSVNIHWFSDVVAGIILGIVIGTTVGKSFKKKLQIST